MTVEIQHQPSPDPSSSGAGSPGAGSPGAGSAGAGSPGGRYALIIDGERQGELDYRVADGVRVYTHTGVRPAYEGHGYAAQLVRRALDDARAEGIRVAATCPYVHHHLEAHPEDQDLVDPVLGARLHP